MERFLKGVAVSCLFAQLLLSLAVHENYAARDSAALMAIACALTALAWRK
jgi:hypothetical protein